MKTLLLSIFMLFIAPQSNNKTYVYICMGPASECYHKNKECRGIKSCSKEVKKVTLDEAIDKYKRRACGYCYKKKSR